MILSYYYLFYVKLPDTTKHERVQNADSVIFHITHMAVSTSHKEKRKSFNSSMLLRLSYKKTQEV